MLRRCAALLIILTILAVTPVQAADYADVTVRLSPGTVGPVSLTVTRTAADTYNLAWSQDPGAPVTMISVSTEGYPDNDTIIGTLIFANAGDNYTWTAPDLQLDSYYFTACSWDDIFGRSANVSQAVQEGLLVVDMIDAIGALTDQFDDIGSTFLILILVLAVNIMAFIAGPRRHGMFLWFLATPVNIVYGFFLAATATLYDPFWVTGIIVAILGLYCLFRAVAGITNREDY